MQIVSVVADGGSLGLVETSMRDGKGDVDGGNHRLVSCMENR
jgi:hypothetical protein